MNLWIILQTAPHTWLCAAQDRWRWYRPRSDWRRQCTRTLHPSQGCLARGGGHLSCLMGLCHEKRGLSVSSRASITPNVQRPSVPLKKPNPPKKNQNGVKCIFSFSHYTAMCFVFVWPLFIFWGCSFCLRVWFVLGRPRQSFSCPVYIERLLQDFVWA